MLALTNKGLENFGVVAVAITFQAVVARPTAHEAVPAWIPTPFLLPQLVLLPG